MTERQDKNIPMKHTKLFSFSTINLVNMPSMETNPKEFRVTIPFQLCETEAPLEGIHKFLISGNQCTESLHSLFHQQQHFYLKKQKEQ